MKKVFSFLAVLALVCMAGTVFAENFSSTTKQARVTFGSAGDIIFDVNVYTWQSGVDYKTGYTGPGLTTPLSFDIGDVTFGSANYQWAPCEQIIKIHSNLSIQAAGGKVYMYTDNKTNSTHTATTGRSEGEGATGKRYNGLVRTTESGLAEDYALLKIVSKTATYANEHHKTSVPAASVFDVMDNGGRTVVDLQDGNYSTLAENSKFIGKTGKDGGVWVGYGTNQYGTGNWYSGSDDAILFLGAAFKGVVANDDYGTETISFVYSLE